MAYHLVCVHPFAKYERGQIVTDQDEVAKLLDDREHHFVRITAPDAPMEAPVEPAPEAPPAKGKAK